MEAVLNAAALLGLAITGPQTAVQLVLPLAANTERTAIVYACEGVEQPFTVEYINSAPNFLALVPVGGEQLLFVTTLSANGARYVSGPFEWWSRGNDATFADLRQELAEPVKCSERTESP